MLPDEDKRHAIQTGQHVQDTQYKAALMAAELIKRILKDIRNNPALKKKIDIDLEKPANVQVNVNGRVAYKGVEGQEPKINSNLAAENWQYVSKAISLKEGQQASEFDRNVSIKVNNQEVFRLRDGVVELNQLEPSSIREAGKAANELNQSEVAPAPTYEVIKEPPSNRAIAINPEQATQSVVKTQEAEQAKEPTVSTSASVIPQPNLNEKKLVVPSTSQSFEQAKESTAQPLASTVSSQEATSSEVQEIEFEPPNKSIADSRVSAFELDSSNKEQLEQLGINPQTVETAVKRAVGQNLETSNGVKKYAPIIVLVERQSRELPTSDRQSSRLEQMAKAVEAAPRTIQDVVKQGMNRLKGVLQQVGQEISQSLGQIQQQVSGQIQQLVRQPFKNRTDRLQDLNSLGAAVTAQRLLDRFGKENGDGTRVFEGNSYRYQQNGSDLTVTAKDGRGTVLAFGEGRLDSNLSGADINQFQRVSSELDKVAAISSRERQAPQTSATRDRQEVER